jgi:hypothetical protein
MAENQMDCMYCHHTVTTSKTANIPSTNLCMNCHIVVREGSRSGRFEIDKLVEAFEEGRSVEWIRIHNLPDHVSFLMHNMLEQVSLIACNATVK